MERGPGDRLRASCMVMVERPADNPAVSEIKQDGPKYRPRIDADMPVKTMVLGGQSGLNQAWRHGFQRPPFAPGILAGQDFPKQPPVAVFQTIRRPKVRPGLGQRVFEPGQPNPSGRDRDQDGKRRADRCPGYVAFTAQFPGSCPARVRKFPGCTSPPPWDRVRRMCPAWRLGPDRRNCRLLR